MIYRVPVTVKEFGRVVVVEADSPGEAIDKARQGDWVESSDANRYVITVSGKVMRDPDAKPS